MVKSRSRKRFGINNKFKGASKRTTFQEENPPGNHQSTVTNGDQASTSSNILPPEVELNLSTASSKKLGTVYKKRKKISKRRTSLQSRLEVPEGYRFIDMRQLSEALLKVHVCPEGEITKNCLDFPVHLVTLFIFIFIYIYIYVLENID